MKWPSLCMFYSQLVDSFDGLTCGYLHTPWHDYVGYGRQGEYKTALIPLAAEG